MSDAGRKDITQQVEEKATPESQKSTFDQAKETVTDTSDKVAASLQPGDSKSTTQKLSDETQTSGKSYAEQAQELAASATQTASNTLSNLASSVTGSGEKK